MKKLFLTLAMIMATSFSVYAENDESSNATMIEAYDIKVNINSLVRYLDLSNWQARSIESVHDVFSDVLRNAVNAEGDSRKKLVKNAIDYYVKNAKWILNDEQYKKYLLVFNATLVNRGIEY